MDSLMKHPQCPDQKGGIVVIGPAEFAETDLRDVWEKFAYQVKFMPP